MKNKILTLFIFLAISACGNPEIKMNRSTPVANKKSINTEAAPVATCNNESKANLGILEKLFAFGKTLLLSNAIEVAQNPCCVLPDKIMNDRSCFLNN